MMIVGVCGLGFTGSTAVVDLLKEFDECYVHGDVEFTLPYYPGGLLDLENAIINPIRFFSYDTAIKRFQELIRKMNSIDLFRKFYGDRLYERSNDYISKITKYSWPGFWLEDGFNANISLRLYMKIGIKINDLLKKKVIRCPQNIYLCQDYSVFLTETKEFISAIISDVCVENSKNIVVLDQPFPGNNPEICFKYFDNPKAIIVIRDPRDVFILGKKFSRGDEWLPVNDVLEFVSYYEQYMVPHICDSSRVLIVRFEDLIYNYNSTVEKIAEYVGLNIRNHNSKAYFKPEMSINNTQLYKTFPEYQCEIQCIEKELANYLYNFGGVDFHADVNHIF